MIELSADAIAGTLNGVTSNALWSLLLQLGVGGYKKLQRVVTHDRAFKKIFDSVAADVVEQLSRGDEQQTRLLKRFLESPEIEASVRELYSCRHLEGRKGQSLDAIHRTFSFALAAYLDTSPEKVHKLARTIWAGLTRGCDRLLSLAIDNNVLSAHEMRSNARFRILSDALDAIDKRLSGLTDPSRSDIDSCIRFEEKYREQVGIRHGMVTPPHFDYAKRIPINQLYVTPQFIPIASTAGFQKNIGLGSFLSRLHRAVVLGTPGCGKSTLANKLCHDASTSYLARPIANKLLTPVLVTVREYGAQKKESRASIVQFIASQASSRYQLTPPNGVFEYLLNSGRVVVVFDGMDELLDTHYRQEVCADIELFCNLYPTVPILVTAREVGYEHAPLDEEKFATFRLAPFNEPQVEEYARKWFSRDTESSEDEKRSKTLAFMEESTSVSDLRSNALMLGLMCNLYYVQGYIPSNRPDVYEKCAVMLFERWDKSRGIVVRLPFKDHVRPAMQFLAHWIYTNPDLANGVTRSELVKHAAEYLNEYVYENELKARGAAEKFVEFCTGRAWVFGDIGMSVQGEHLYQFTHRTFLEYFAAAHLVSVEPTATRLCRTLVPHIARREWDVVALLSFQMFSRRVHGGADIFLEEVLQESGQRNGREVQGLLTFAARCLGVAVPKPRTRKAVVEKCFQWCLSVGGEANSTTPSGAAVLELFGYLLASASDNRGSIAEQLEEFLVASVQDGATKRELIPIQLGMNLVRVCQGTAKYTGTDREAGAVYGDVSKRFSEKRKTAIKRTSSVDLFVSACSARAGIISVAEHVNWHGIKGLLNVSQSESQLGLGLAPYGAWEAKRLFIAQGDNPPAHRGLAEISQYMMGLDIPWVSSSEIWVRAAASQFADLARQARSDVRCVRSSAFAVCAMLSIVIEVLQNDERDALATVICGSNNSTLRSMGKILQRRLRQVSAVECDREIDSLELSVGQRRVVSSWANHESNLVSLVASHGSSRLNPPVANVLESAYDGIESPLD